MKIDMLPMAVNFGNCEEIKTDKGNRGFLNFLNNKIEKSSADKSENIKEVEINDSDKDSEDELIALMTSILNALGKLDNNQLAKTKDIPDLTINLELLEKVLVRLEQKEGINAQNLGEFLKGNKLEELLSELNLDLDKLDLSKEEITKLFIKIVNKLGEGKVSSSIEKGETALKPEEHSEVNDIKSVKYMKDTKNIEGTKNIQGTENIESTKNIQGATMEQPESSIVHDKPLDIKDKLFDLGAFKHRNIVLEEKPSNSQGELSLLNRIAFSSDSKVEIPKEAAPTVVRNEFLGADMLKVVKYISNNRIEELSVKITPKELGEVSIKLLKAEDNNELIITLANKKAYELIKDNVADIEKHLSNLDIKIKEVVVQVKNEVYSDFLGNFNEQFNKNNSREQQKNNLTKKEGSFEEEQENQGDESNINLLV